MYRLLIVDDEEDIRNGMSRGIPWKEWGFTVVGIAENGEEAVFLTEKEKPDVVLSDIRMPKMDGVELMQYLHDNLPEIKIVILSGYNDLEYLNMAIKNQVTEYMLKPTDIDEFEQLFRKIRKNLDEEKSRREELNQLKLAAMQSQALSYETVLNNLLDGYVGDSREYAWKQELEKEGMDFNACVMVILDTASESEDNKDDSYRLKQRIIRYCNSRQMQWVSRFFLYRGGHIVGLVTLEQMRFEEPGPEMRLLSECVEEMQAEIGDIYGMALRAGISDLCRDERMLPLIYQETEARMSSVEPDLLNNQKKSNLLVTAVREYIDREFTSNMLSLETVAERFNRNPAYISKVFKKGTGFNFSDYITQKRMEKSKALLRDMSLKVYEIAEMTGYADVSNFIKVFRKKCGMSPNEYRSLM